jgi:Xaa-Pro dipeptidase
MARRRIDGLVLTRPENIYYLSNFRAAPIAAWTARFHALAIPAVGEPRLLARLLEAASAASQWTSEPLLVADHQDPFHELAQAIRGDRNWQGARRIGVEQRYLSVAQSDALARAFTDVEMTVELVDVTGEVEAIAAELSPWELGCMRRAAQVTQSGMNASIRALRPGLPTYELLGTIQEAMYSAGQSDFEKSFVAVWAGPDGGMMHDTRTTHVLTSGDIATIEVMGVDQHYTACAQTTVLVGTEQPRPEVSRAYELVIDMHAAARSALRAGVTAGEVFAAANTVYRAATGGDYFRRVGGSLGLTLFALDLVKDSRVTIPEGTPMLVQVLVNEPALLTCTSAVIVTPTGVEELTPAIVCDALLGR